MHESRPTSKTSCRLRALLVAAISAVIAGLLAYTYYSVASERYRLAGAAGLAIVIALAWLIVLLMDRRPAQAGITGPLPGAIAAAKRWPIRYQLLGLVLVVAAPLAVLVTMHLYANIHQFEESAYLTVRNVAQDLKRDTEKLLADSKHRLELLAARRLGKAMDPNRCDPLIGEIRKLLPEYANVALRDIDGRLVCGDLSQPGQWPVSAADFEWFREGKEREDFTVGKAFVGKVTGGWVSVLTYPVRDDQRQILGLLILPIDLEFLHRQAAIFVLPPGSVTALIDRDGTFIAHSTDPGRVGQNFRGKEITDIVLRGDRGEVKAVGTDAIKRIYSYDTLPGAGWHVYAGIPSDIVLAPARAGAIEGAAITAALLVVIAGLGFLISRSIEAPLRAIGGVASEIAHGNLEVRATLDDSREIAQVAAQFNAMLDAQHIAQQQLRRSEALLNETQAFAKVGGWEYDVASDSITWTDEVFRIYELSRDYDPGNVQRDIALFPASERVGLAGAFQRAVEQGEPYDLELQYVTANWRKLWVRTVGQAERNEGKVVRVFGNIIDITERKRAEVTQANLAAIVENSYDAIIGRAVDGTVTSWNAAAERILGYPAAEAIGRELIEIQPPELRQEIAERRKRLLAGQPGANWETVRVAKDGRRIDMAISVSAIKDNSGNIIGTAVILRDITERKQAERELQHKTELAQLLEQLARAANEAVSPEAAMETCLASICENGKWALGRVATFLPGLSHYNREYSQWFCMEPARFGAFVRYSEGFEHNSSTGKFVSLVLRDRSPVWLPDLTVLDNPESGRFVKAVEAGLKAAFAFPVIVRGEVVAVLEFYATETRQPDALLIEGTSGLASQFARMIERSAADEARTRLAAIVENSNDAILGRALDGTVTSWNAAAERILGYTAAEVLGRDLVEIFPPELRQQIAAIRDLVRTGQSVPSHEAVRITKDGRRIDVTLSISSLRDNSGNIIGTAAILRDITERKQAEQALHDYARRLQGLSRRLVAVEEIERRKINRELHDRIGQNLAALNINLNIIRSQLPQESLPAVSAHLQKMQTLFEETAAHARNVMADLHPPALDDYGLLAALRSYVESYGARVVVPITVHGEDLAPRLSPAAEMALFRIAQGAIANAVQHARAKRIEVLLAATPERVTLTIADDGAGFDPKRVVPAHASWGLTIMQERAEAVGARLTVESAPGKGTRVGVEIDRLTGSKPAMNADEFG